MGFGWLSLGTCLGGAAAWVGGTLVARRRADGFAGPRPLPEQVAIEQVWQLEGGLPSPRDERLDVDAEARWAMAALEAEARDAAVGRGIAVTPALAVWMDKRAFRKLLIEALTQAIRSAPGGRVLLTACPHGGRVQIGISHDGPGRPSEVGERASRSLAEMAVTLGGTLEILRRFGRGETTVIRLPEPPFQTVRASGDPIAARSQSGQSRAVGLVETAQPAAAPLMIRQGLLSP